MLITKDEIHAMTIEEKYELLDMLWESLEREDYADDAEEETEEEVELLRERLEEYKVDPSKGIKWENLKDELLKQRDEQSGSRIK